MNHILNGVDVLLDARMDDPMSMVNVGDSSSSKTSVFTMLYIILLILSHTVFNIPN